MIRAIVTDIEGTTSSLPRQGRALPLCARAHRGLRARPRAGARGRRAARGHARGAGREPYGDFAGHVYPDAREALERWHARGIRLYVYSSGSVHAQRLLFGHTEYGDLNPLFDGYFDTRVGAKTDADSHRRIAREIGLDPGEILFLSDSEPELDAARAAGMQTRWLVRDAAPVAAAHPQVRSFAGIEV